MKIPKVAIIGTGRVGSNLALQLFENGFCVVGLIDLNFSRAEILARQVNCGCASNRLKDLPDSAEIIFITTADHLIESVCRQISELPVFFEKKLVLHCSGALSSDALEAVRQNGALVASAHPVQTFIPIEFGPTKLDGVFWAIEGEAAALVPVRWLIQRLRGHFFEIPAEKKDLYHAACVISSNYLVALSQMSTLLFTELGVPAEQSLKILAPLQNSALRNIQKNGPEAAITGPIARGDLATVERHLEIIQKKTPKVLKTYIELGRILLQLCEFNQILDAVKTFEFEQLFRNYSEI